MKEELIITSIAVISYIHVCHILSVDAYPPNGSYDHFSLEPPFPGSPLYALLASFFLFLLNAKQLPHVWPDAVWHPGSPNPGLHPNAFYISTSFLSLCLFFPLFRPTLILLVFRRYMCVEIGMEKYFHFSTRKPFGSLYSWLALGGLQTHFGIIIVVVRIADVVSYKNIHVENLTLVIYTCSLKSKFGKSSNSNLP